MGPLLGLFTGLWACTTPADSGTVAGPDEGAGPVTCADVYAGVTLAAEQVAFLDATASPGGDGSESRPFASLAEGLSAWRAGGAATLVLAAGRFPERLALDAADTGLHICGHGDAVLDAGGVDGDWAVALDGDEGSEVEIGGLEIDGGGGLGVAVLVGELTATHLEITDTVGRAVSVAAGAGFSLEDGDVRGHRSDDSDATAIRASSGSSLTLRRTTIADVQGMAVDVYTGADSAEVANLVLEDVEISSLVPDAAGLSYGVYAGVGGDEPGGDVRLEATRVGVHGATYGWTLVGANGGDSTATLTDVTLDAATAAEGTFPTIGICGYYDLTLEVVEPNIGPFVTDGSTHATAICALYRPTLTITGGAIRDVTGGGVQAREAKVDVSGLTVSGTRAWHYVTDDGVVHNTAAAFSLIDSDATVDALTFEDNESTALSVLGGVTTVTDTRIRDTSAPEGAVGFGVQVQAYEAGAAFEATNLTVEHTAGVGVIALGGGTRVHLHGLVVDGVQWAGLASDVGVFAATGALIQVDESSLITDVYGFGVLASDASVSLEDTSITNVGASDSDSQIGVAIGASGGGSIEATLVAISGVEGPGLVATGGSVSCTTCSILDTQFAAVVAEAGTVSLTGGVIADVTRARLIGGGMGVYATTRYGVPTVAVAEVTVRDTLIAAFYLDGPGDYTIADCPSVEGGSASSVGGRPANGNAVFAYATEASSGGHGLLLRGNTFVTSDLAVLVEAGGATLDGNAYDTNTLDVVNQDCEESASTLDGVEEAAAWQECEDDPYHMFVDPQTLDFYFEYIVPEPPV